MKAILSIIISSALAVSGYSQTRNVLVGTNNAVVQPTNFWSADASNARTGLGLGTAATNPSSVFQPASSVLTNLANSNGANLTNLILSNVNGLQVALDEKLATNGSAANLTNFPVVGLASNVTGMIAISNGGTGATNASDARLFLGLGSAATNPSSAFQPSSAVLSNVASNNAASLTNIQASNVSGTIAISNGGSGANNAGGARTNFGLGATWLTNTNVTNFRTAIGLGATNDVIFADITLTEFGEDDVSVENSSGSILLRQTTNVLVEFGTGAFHLFYNAIGFNNTTNAAATRTNLGLGATWLTNNNVTNFRTAIGLGATNDVEFNSVGQDGGYRIDFAAGTIYDTEPTNVAFSFGGTWYLPIAFSTNTVAATTRTNLGLGWPALTNSNAGTGLVSVNTNGEVVSPTNFWQVAPISTTVQYQTNVTATSTNAATNSRNLFLFSLAPTVSGVTNTVTLPTNAATTFEGDRATIVHLATNSANAVTAIRQLGAATNLITLNQVDEAVLLIYRGGAWGLGDNISYIEPIYFSGTNAAANAAASRTNLGLGTTNNVQFGGVVVNGVFEAASNRVEVFQPVLIADRDSTNAVFQFETPSDVAIARTNLGLPLAALTNTNAAGFQRAILQTNTTPTNFSQLNDAKAWLEISVVTNNVTNSFRIPVFQ